MTSDDARNSHPDVRFAPVGMGMLIRWNCFGCGQSRDRTGSKGVGIRQRCAVCLAARADKMVAQ